MHPPYSRQNLDEGETTDFDIGNENDDMDDNNEDFIVDVDCNTNLDDEELISAREKKRQKNNRKKSNQSDNESEENDHQDTNMELKGDEMEVENDEADVEEVKEGENDPVGNDTDYYDSENEGSVEELSNDDGEVDIRQRKSQRVVYDPECERSKFVLGMVFANNTQLKEACIRYAINKGAQILFVKSEPNRVRAVCKKGCPWIVFGGRDSRSGDLRIKYYFLNIDVIGHILISISLIQISMELQFIDSNFTTFIRKY
ncbi:hypothetical protein GH714_008600 [Hevea brasiliensis]|uniref:Transposase MuDR plant domain-containing protein n=1 Tax=Hevea brasiliensis TaxID=3981 RepID=A0A6A6LHT9_HEVBR|nr:hypothetical protein GH714_008600 [Hevea brasiliensis]